MEAVAGAKPPFALTPSFRIANAMAMYRNCIKRALDISSCVAALVVFAPVMLIVAICIRVFMGKPILFRQERPGRHSRSFTCLKFRTMTNQRAKDGELLSERERMVPLGAWLRRTSFDELPQLWNVLRGDLSFVGPRPLLKEFLPFYTPEEQRRHSVRPGITGWAQIHGRNELNFDERLRMDVWYVDRLSWQLDLRILLATIRLVFSAKGTDLMSYPPLHEQRRSRLELSKSAFEQDHPASEEGRSSRSELHHHAPR